MEDHDDDSDDEASSLSNQYAFPDLDAHIRTVINEYGAVFPKLNFSSPKARLGQATIPALSWNKPNNYLNAGRSLAPALVVPLEVHVPG